MRKSNLRLRVLALFWLKLPGALVGLEPKVDCYGDPLPARAVTCHVSDSLACALPSIRRMDLGPLAQRSPMLLKPWTAPLPLLLAARTAFAGRQRSYVHDREKRISPVGYRWRVQMVK